MLQFVCFFFVNWSKYSLQSAFMTLQICDKEWGGPMLGNIQLLWMLLVLLLLTSPTFVVSYSCHWFCGWKIELFKLKYAIIVFKCFFSLFFLEFYFLNHQNVRHEAHNNVFLYFEWWFASPNKSKRNSRLACSWWWYWLLVVIVVVVSSWMHAFSVDFDWFWSHKSQFNNKT